mgnify:FL=1
MIPDPRTTIIPRHLLESLGEARAIVWKVLPLSDDGNTMILYCPTDGNYDSKFASLFGRELGRTIEFIPVERSQLMQAIEEQFATIQDCPPQFSFLCPKTWQSLESTNTETIRFCPSCQKNVYWCTTPAEVRAYGAKGLCIAVSSSVTYSSPSFPDQEFFGLVGRPSDSFQSNGWVNFASYWRLLMDRLRNLLSSK